ncbi:MAG: tetratricopeptide repeat protein [Candidatus Sungbacteria bacterium]|nr:tetratricopeptide repeat protein [Candidatus Sungbacteria bacterium]
MEYLIVQLDRVSRYVIFILAGMIPLWILPVPVAVEFGREVSFLAVIAVGGVAWILSSLLRGEMRIQQSPILSIAGALLLVLGVSTWFSSSWSGSVLFWDPAAERLGVVMAAVFAMILAGAVPTSPKDRMCVLGALLCSGMIAALITFFELAFKVSPFSILGSFAASAEFNPVGTINGVSLLYAVLFILGLGILFSPAFFGRKAWIRYGIGISLILYFIDIFLINFPAAWIVLLGSGVVLLGLVFHSSGLFKVGGSGLKGMGWRPISLMACLLIFLAMVFFKGHLPFQATISPEVRPSLASTIGITEGVYRQSMKAFLIGSGPGTFVFDWGKYRDPAVNRTIFWGVRFNQGFSWLFSAAATSGILGFLVLVGFLGVSLLVLLRGVLKVANSRDGLEIGLFVSICTLVMIAVLYPATVTFLMMLFLLIGVLSSSLAIPAPIVEITTLPVEPAETSDAIGMNGTVDTVEQGVITLPAHMPDSAHLASFSSRGKEDETVAASALAYETEKMGEAPAVGTPPKSLLDIREHLFRFEKPWSIFLASLGLILSLGLGVTAFGYQIVRVQAALAKHAGTDALARGDIKTAETKLTAARDATPNDPSIARAVTELGIAKIRVIIAEALRGKNVQSDFRDEVARTIELARRGTALAPDDAEQWRAQGALYELIIPFVPGAEQHALGSYEHAAELEPGNPQIFADQGRAYSVLADRIQLTMNQGQGGDKHVLDDARTAALADARKVLMRASELKPDFSLAAFLLAQVDIRMGNRAEAIKNTEIAKAGAPQDIGVAFQLGLLYYQTNNMGPARAEFERAISLNRDYANARYFVGLINDREGDHEGAIAQFEYIEKSNPDNGEVKKILENVRAGRSALDGIIQPPTPSLAEAESEAALK